MGKGGEGMEVEEQPVSRCGVYVPVRIICSTQIMCSSIPRIMPQDVLARSDVLRLVQYKRSSLCGDVRLIRLLARSIEMSYCVGIYTSLYVSTAD
jgi:hypothetical protein